MLVGASVTVRHGDRVLLGGPSGAGKSTLASVLAGSRLPASGSLRLAGANRLAVADEAWRRRVVMAQQFGKNHLLSASVAFNLLLGRAVRNQLPRDQTSMTATFFPTFMP